MKTAHMFRTGAVGTLALVTLTACVQSSSPSAPQGTGGAGESLTVFISGGDNVRQLWQDSIVPAFTKANPGFSVTVNLDLHGEHDSQTLAKLTSSSQQNKDPGFDLVDGGFVTQAASAGLLTPVSTSNVPGLANVPAKTIKAGGNGGIPYRGSSVLLAYDSKTVTNPPKTLDDVLAWIKANPGKFTYNTPNSGGSGQSFVTTVLDKFVPADDRLKMETSYAKDTEKDWDQGFALLASLNPYIYQKGVYPNGNDQILSLLSSGQISMAPVWSDQFINGQKSGQIPATAKYTQISSPSLTGGAAYLGIPKSSPRQAAALKLANFVLTPEIQVLMVNSLASYPVVDLAKLPPEVQQQFKDTASNDLRLTYFSSLNSDLNNLWAQKVPGK